MCTHLRMSLLPALLASLDSLIMCWWVSNTSDLSVRRLGSFLMSQSTSCTDCVNNGFIEGKNNQAIDHGIYSMIKTGETIPLQNLRKGCAVHGLLTCTAIHDTFTDSGKLGMYGRTWRIGAWTFGAALIGTAYNPLHTPWNVSLQIFCIHKAMEDTSWPEESAIMWNTYSFRRVGGRKDSAQVIREGPES